MEPEPIILYKLLAAFGPPPDELVQHIGVDPSGQSVDGGLLVELWKGIEENKLQDPFRVWTKDVYPNLDEEAKRLILRMANFDSAKREPLSEILKDSYWD